MSSRPARALAGARQVALWLAAIVGVLCVLVAVASFAFGLRPLVFRSGSMAPAIDTGALAIAHRVDAGDLRRDDVVSVPTSGGERVTHRVVSVEHLGDQAVLRLQGDANDAADASPYVVRGADVVLFSVPKVGTAVGWVTTPVGLVALSLYAGYLIVVIVRGPARRPPPSGGGRRRNNGARHRGTRAAVVLPLVAATLASGALTMARTEPTLAAWTDGVAVSGTTLATYSVPAPAGNGCAVWAAGSTTLRGVDLTWPATVAPLPSLSYAPAVSGLTGATTSVVSVGPDDQLQVRYDPSLLANQDQAVTVTVTPRLTSAEAWTGPTTSWTFQTGGTATQPTCG